MKTVYADTFYIIALLNQSDAAHARALAFTTNFMGVNVPSWGLAGFFCCKGRHYKRKS